MTDTLIDALAQAIDLPLHTVLHIGCGPTPLQGYGDLQAQRLLLVEGDPDTFADLAAELKLSGRTGVQALHRVVLPEEGEALWHRYNVRRLNAPQPMTALSAVYPRLKELSPLPQHGCALAALAKDLLPAQDDARCGHALVLDVPGQEAALLATLSPELLRRFHYVAVRGAEQSTGAGWAPLASTVERLQADCFRPVRAASPITDPLWPATVMRFDSDAFARAQLLARCNELKAALALSNARLVQSDARAASLLKERDEQAKRVAERQAQIDTLTDTLTQTKAAAEKHAVDRASQLQQMTQQRDEQAKRVRELEDEVGQLQLRQRLLEEEMIKAEGQIELIKDVLLRELGL